MSRWKILTVTFFGMTLLGVGGYFIFRARMTDRAPASLLEDKNNPQLPSSGTQIRGPQSLLQKSGRSPLEDEKVPDPDQLSLDALIQEVANPQARTLQQRSAALHALMNHSDQLSPQKQAELVLRQLRSPLPEDGVDDPHFIFSYYFEATALFFQDPTQAQFKQEEWVETVLAQSSNIARKAILSQIAEMAPQEVEGILFALTQKGLRIPPLDGVPTENLPELESPQQ